jgi:hypothetical protein
MLARAQVPSVVTLTSLTAYHYKVTRWHTEVAVSTFETITQVRLLIIDLTIQQSVPVAAAGAFR